MGWARTATTSCRSCRSSIWPARRPIRFVFPHAPMQPVTINNGYVMRAWYDVKWGDLEGRSKQADETGVRDSQKSHRHSDRARMLARHRAEGSCSPDSPRAARSPCRPGLRFPRKLAGIMALSTYLPLAESSGAEASAGESRDADLHGARRSGRRRSCRIRWVCVRETCSRSHGYEVEWHEYPMAALRLPRRDRAHRRRGCSGRCGAITRQGGSFTFHSFTLHSFTLCCFRFRSQSRLCLGPTASR